ncbi:endonuclease/exonuclease/phosphatase family protein [Rhizobium beringeri]
MLREFSQDDKATNKPPLFRLMSFNIAIDNWRNSTEITDMVIASNADVVNLLSQPLTFHLQQLFKAYPYHIGCDAGKDTCDTLVLSKRPFVSRQVASMGSLRKNRLVIASVDFGGETINLVSAHLTKPYFDDFQMAELEDLAKAVGSIDGPLVLSGDFNSSVIAPSIPRFPARTEAEDDHARTGNMAGQRRRARNRHRSHICARAASSDIAETSGFQPWLEPFGPDSRFCSRQGAAKRHRQMNLPGQDILPGRDDLAGGANQNLVRPPFLSII